MRCTAMLLLGSIGALCLLAASFVFVYTMD
jgi:hypothetical protein